MVVVIPMVMVVMMMVRGTDPDSDADLVGPGRRGEGEEGKGDQGEGQEEGDPREEAGSRRKEALDGAIAAVEGGQGRIAHPLI